MRQEVRARVTITYDAPAEWSAERLHDGVHDDLVRLLDADSTTGVEAQHIRINSIEEEAVIYGNNEPGPFAYLHLNAAGIPEPD